MQYCGIVKSFSRKKCIYIPPAGGEPPGLGRLTCGLGLAPPAAPRGDIGAC